jgi:predicted Fe-S protein YdhL (DUF1289 family)
MSLNPPSTWKKGKAAWNRLLPEQRDYFLFKNPEPEITLQQKVKAGIKKKTEPPYFKRGKAEAVKAKIELTEAELARLPNPPRHIYHKGKAAWYKLSPESRQAIIDRYNQKITAKGDLIKRRAAEAKTNGLSPESEAKWRELKEGKDPNEELFSSSPSDISDATNVNQNVEEAEKEGKQVVIGYKNYEQRMTSIAPRDCDLDLAVRERLLTMYLIRNGLWDS